MRGVDRNLYRPIKAKCSQHFETHRREIREDFPPAVVTAARLTSELEIDNHGRELMLVQRDEGGGNIGASLRRHGELPHRLPELFDRDRTTGYPAGLLGWEKVYSSHSYRFTTVSMLHHWTAAGLWTKERHCQ
jgi:hypothetical protein